jgi:transcriptional regulator with XRE-family HTH domain
MLDTKQILQENLKALLDTRPETSRLNLSREMKVGDGTLGSIQYGKGNPTLQVLETIAQFFELETWQLLCPDLGQSSASARAKVCSESFGPWPFGRVKPADFSALPREDRDEIEHQIGYKVKRLKENRIRKKKP